MQHEHDKILCKNAGNDSGLKTGTVNVLHICGLKCHQTIRGVIPTLPLPPFPLLPVQEEGLFGILVSSGRNVNHTDELLPKICHYF